MGFLVFGVPFPLILRAGAEEHVVGPSSFTDSPTDDPTTDLFHERALGSWTESLEGAPEVAVQWPVSWPGPARVELELSAHLGPLVLPWTRGPYELPSGDELIIPVEIPESAWLEDLSADCERAPYGTLDHDMQELATTYAVQDVDIEDLVDLYVDACPSNWMELDRDEALGDTGDFTWETSPPQRILLSALHHGISLKHAAESVHGLVHTDPD